MKRVLQWHQLAGCVIHCSAAHVETSHVKATQCRRGYFLTSVVNLYVSISVWVSAGCVFHRVRRVRPGSAPLGIIPWRVSCFAHDNTVSFFKGTSCMYKPCEQSYYCTTARVRWYKGKNSWLKPFPSFYQVLQNLNSSPLLKDVEFKEQPPQGLTWVFKSLSVK